MAGWVLGERRCNVMWGISTEWWILYILIFVCALSICILLGLITTVVNAACNSVETCAIRSADISNIYKLLSADKGSTEADSGDKKDIPALIMDIRDSLDKQCLELQKLLSKIVSLLEGDRANQDEISKTESDFDTEISI
jgi:hypothetical protein